MSSGERKDALQQLNLRADSQYSVYSCRWENGYEHNAAVAPSACNPEYYDDFLCGWGKLLLLVPCCLIAIIGVVMVVCQRRPDDVLGNAYVPQSDQRKIGG